MFSEEQRYLDARRRVRLLAGFYRNLASYVIINIFLVILNLVTSPHTLWFYWPMLGWGVGIVFHGMTVFFPQFGRDWEERKIKEILDREPRD